MERGHGVSVDDLLSVGDTLFARTGSYTAASLHWWDGASWQPLASPGAASDTVVMTSVAAHEGIWW